MQNIFNTINPTDWFTTTNGIISSLTPLIMLLLGILVAFFIIDSIIGVFKDVKAAGEHFRNKKYDDDNNDDDDYDNYFN